MSVQSSGKAYYNQCDRLRDRIVLSITRTGLQFHAGAGNFTSCHHRGMSIFIVQTFNSWWISRPSMTGMLAWQRGLERPMLTVELLGDPKLQIVDGEHQLEVQMPSKGLALVGYLIYTQEPCSRRDVAQMLWSGRPHSAAQTNLRQLLKRIKQSFPYGLAWEDQDVEWAPTLPWTCDLRQFESTVQLTWQGLHSGKRFSVPALNADMHDSIDETAPLQLDAETRKALQAAITLYKADFLNSLELDDSPAFGEWLHARREELRRKLLWAATLLARHGLANNDYQPGIAALRRAISIAPWHESSHRQLIRLLVMTGQRKDALDQYAACTRVLARELNIGPSVDTEMLYADIMAAERPASCEAALNVPPKQMSPQRVVHEPATNLPRAAQSTISRHALLEKLVAAIRVDAARMVTLIGIGGVGKSIFALEVGHALIKDFPDGVWRVVPGTGVLWEKCAKLARKYFGVQLDASEEVLEYFSQLTALLILDDCDGVHAQSPWLEQLLERAPHLVLLMTARRRLRLPSERSFWLAGLPIPSPTQLDIATYVAGQGEDCIQLFIQAAQLIQPDFQLRRSDLFEILAICHEVGGLPLAIVQAANWIGQLPLPQIRYAIEQDVGSILPVFTDDDPHTSSIGSVFSRSWHDLGLTGQKALMRLAVFKDSFTLDAASQVADVSLPTLLQLVDHSLINHEHGDVYQWHPLVRRFVRAVNVRGIPLSIDVPDVQDLRSRYADYFMRFLADRAEEYTGRSPRKALYETEQLWSEIQNAWEVLLAQRRIQLCPRALRGLAEFCAVTRRTSLAALLMQQIVERLETTTRPNADVTATGSRSEPCVIDETSEVLAWAYLYYSRFSLAEGALSTTRVACRRAGILAQVVEKSELFAESLLTAAQVARHENNRAEARRLLIVALEQAKEADALRTQALVLREMVADKYESEDDSLPEQLIELAHRCGDIALEIEQLSMLGIDHVLTGHWDKGTFYLERAARSGFAAVVTDETLSSLMIRLAQADFVVGNHDSATARLRQVLAVTDRGGQIQDAVLAHLYLSEIASRSGLAAQALSDIDTGIALVAANKLSHMRHVTQGQSARVLAACSMITQARRSYEQLLSGQELADAPVRELWIWAGWIDFLLAHGDGSLARNLGVMLLMRLEQAEVGILAPGWMCAWRTALEIARQRKDVRFVDLVDARFRELECIAVQMSDDQRTTFWHAVPEHAQIAKWYAQSRLPAVDTGNGAVTNGRYSSHAHLQRTSTHHRSPAS